MRSVRVCVPASSANVGPGFDALAVALELPLWLDVRMEEQARIDVYGDALRGVPVNEHNLVLRTMRGVFAHVGCVMPPVRVQMYSAIPLARGLGSSAAAIVAAIVAANALMGDRLTRADMLTLAARMEGHPDNVAAALYGQCTVASQTDAGVVAAVLPVPELLSAVVAIPHYALSTHASRAVLPTTVPFADAVHNVSHVALLVAALATGNVALLTHAMRDRLHEPYRMGLVSGLADVCAGARDYGALGCVLSGAGPTVMALVSSEHNEALARYMTDTLARPHRPTVLGLRIARVGARITDCTVPFEDVVAQAEQARGSAVIRWP
ncbi:MAG: homoserine kinase [Paenibacillaceae bacterium]|jgi:homoserine kinase|nr:homoserine kinase [Paenibacillaceae bacterium]